MNLEQVSLAVSISQALYCSFVAATSIKGSRSVVNMPIILRHPTSENLTVALNLEVARGSQLGNIFDM